MHGLIEMPGVVQPERPPDGASMRTHVLYTALQFGGWGFWFWGRLPATC